MTDQSHPAHGEVKVAVTIPRELFDFLMGVGEIDGTSFGDLNDNLPGRFWWRSLMRACERSAPPATDVALRDMLEPFTEQPSEEQQAIDAIARDVSEGFRADVSRIMSADSSTTDRDDALAVLTKWHDNTPLYEGNDPRAVYYRRNRKALEAAINALATTPPDQPTIGDALETLRRETALLLQNAEGCAANHYGNDIQVHGMPPWIYDCRERITNALATIAAMPKGGGGWLHFEDHPVGKAIIAVRHRAAADFSEPFSGQRGMDFDRGLLAAFEAAAAALRDRRAK